MRSKLTWIAACLLALGLIAAGCGGDDGNDDSTEGTGTGGTEALTKSEFIAQADAICKEGNKQIEKAGKKIGESSSAAEVDAFAADTVAPAIQSQLDGIEALGAPTGDESQVDAILSAAQAATDKLKNDPSLLRSEGETLYDDANKLAQDYGLKVCGSD